MQKVTLCTEIVEKNPFQSTHSLIHMKIFTSITVLIGNTSREALFMQGLFLPVLDAGTACGAVPV
ncbi:hypothetical protein [Aeromonas salmonicida]